MKILVTCPTSAISRSILDELLAPEFSVRLIASDTARLPRELLKQVELVRGSIEDPVVLRESLEGVDSLFWCAPPEATRTWVRQAQLAGAACEALRDARTPRVVAVSRERASEAILNRSGAAIRHLRCGAMIDDEALQGTLATPSRSPASEVTAADIADAALRWLVRRDWAGIKSIDLCPEDGRGAHALAFDCQMETGIVQATAGHLH